LNIFKIILYACSMSREQPHSSAQARVRQDGVAVLAEEEAS